MTHPLPPLGRFSYGKPGEWTFNRQDGCWYICGTDCSICLQPRPEYCNRGNWHAMIEIYDGAALHIDDADGWPRYYFDLQRAKAEIEAWLIRRKQIPPTRIPDEFAASPGRVQEMFAYLCEDAPGSEAVPAALIGDMHFPLMGADMRRIESLRPLASEMAVRLGKSLIIAKFSQRTDIDSISAAQAKFDAMVQGGASC